MKILENKIRRSMNAPLTRTEKDKAASIRAAETVIENSAAFRCGNIAIENSKPLEIYVYSINDEGDIRETFYSLEIVGLVAAMNGVHCYMEIKDGNIALRIYA